MDKEKDKQQSIAIFRYGIIAPALHMGALERGKYLKGLAGKEFDVPYYGLKRYAKVTFEEWLLKYRKFGLDGLKPQRRNDKGVSRKISDNIISITSSIINEYPNLSGSGIYRLLINRGHIQAGDFCESTLREYIHKHSLRIDEEIRPRKKYEKENVNELWIADFMHGPYIKDGNKKRQVFLCGIIDDHSRLIVGWSWYWQENTNALANTLKQAIAIFGLPQVFYCDNGKVFSANYLQLIAAKLGIALVHSQPYDSPSRGKIERFFKTVREKFLAGLNTSGLSLDEFIKLFSQWIDKEYHKGLHSGINDRPLDRYLTNAAKTKIKTIPGNELDNYFLNIITRRVKNDATVSYGGKLYEVPPKYIGKEVELSYPIDQPERLTLMDEGKPTLQIKQVNLIENANKPHTGIHFSRGEVTEK